MVVSHAARLTVRRAVLKADGRISLGILRFGINMKLVGFYRTRLPPAVAGFVQDNMVFKENLFGFGMVDSFVAADFVQQPAFLEEGKVRRLEMYIAAFRKLFRAL